MKINLLKITLLLSSMMTMMAGAVVAPSLPQINLHFESTPQADILTRLIITLPAIFIALASPLYGWLIDRFGRKKFLLVSLIIYAFAGTSGFFMNDLYSILVGRAILGIAVAGIMTTSTTLIGDYFQGEERNRFVGLQGAFIGLGAVVFLSAAGFLADIRWQLPFLIYLFSVPILFLAVKFLHEPQRESKKNEAKGDARFNYSRLRVYWILFLSFFGIVFFYMLPVQIPYLLKGMPNVNNSMVGIAISSSTLSSALVSFNLRRIRKIASFPAIYITAFSVMGIGYLMVAGAENYTFVLFGLLIAGLGLGMFMPAGNLWMMEVVPAQIRGRMIGRLSTATFTAMFLSPILLQPAVSFFKIDGAFALASILLIGMAFVILVGYFVEQRKQAKNQNAQN